MGLPESGGAAALPAPWLVRYGDNSTMDVNWQEGSISQTARCRRVMALWAESSVSDAETRRLLGDGLQVY